MREETLRESLNNLILDLNRLKNSLKTLKYTNKKLRAENKLLHEVIDQNQYGSENVVNKLTQTN